MANLTRDEILGSNDRKTKTVQVSEWKKGGVVTVITWSAKQRDQFDTYVFKNREKDINLRAVFAAISIIDPDTREQLFTVNDIEALEQKSEAPLTRVWEAAAGLNPVLTTQFEEIGKNS